MKRKELVEALELVLPGVGEETTGLNSVLFEDDWVKTYNEDLSVSLKFQTGLSGGVPFDLLFKTADRMKGVEIELTSDDKKIQLKDGKTRLKLEKKTEEKLSRLKTKLADLELDKLEWKPLPTSFLDGLALAMFSADKDANLGKLSGVIVDEGAILSTDNYRISQYTLDSSIYKDTIRITTAAVRNLLRVNKKFDSVSLTRREINGEITPYRLHFKSGDNLIVTARLLPMADFPLAEVLGIFVDSGIESAVETHELPKNLEESIDRVTVLASEGEGEMNWASSVISLKTADGNLIVYSKSQGVGEIEDSIPWVGVLPGAGMMNVQSTFLKKVLSLTRSFKVSDDKKMVMFQTPVFKHIMSVGVGI